MRIWFWRDFLIEISFCKYHHSCSIYFLVNTLISYIFISYSDNILIFLLTHYSYIIVNVDTVYRSLYHKSYDWDILTSHTFCEGEDVLYVRTMSMINTIEFFMLECKSFNQLIQNLLCNIFEHILFKSTTSYKGSWCYYKIFFIDSYLCVFHPSVHGVHFLMLSNQSAL